MGQATRESSRVAARLIADKYCVTHKVMSVDLGSDVSPGPTGGAFRYVSFMLYSLATMHARANEIYIVAGGTMPERVNAGFREALENLLKTHKDQKYPSIFLPLWAMPKPQVYEIVKTDPIWTATISCSVSEPPCGQCFKCKERASVLGGTN
jgi:7-cyano-7-deazaguanine synthase in queuosine biosynthesis